MTDQTRTPAPTRAEQALAVLAEQLAYWTPVAMPAPKEEAPGDALAYYRAA